MIEALKCILEHEVTNQNVLVAANICLGSDFILRTSYPMLLMQPKTLFACNFETQLLLKILFFIVDHVRRMVKVEDI
jgi:hypothetical protein